MDFDTIIPDKPVSLFVKNILIFDDQNLEQKTILPIFADGYPGLIFQETKEGLLVNPHNKLMPPLFLYGQTIKPIEMVMMGAYNIIVFQLYPFVLKSFFNLAPYELNDDCYNLEQLGHIATDTVDRLRQTSSVQGKTEVISAFLYSLFQRKQQEIDLEIAFAIKKIIRKKGQLTIKELYEEVHLTERTFHRRFFNAVGVTAKQFAKIIQFQQSLEQLTVKDYTKLTDIAYSNGFADQSHFIKVFKAFTGKTPLAFKSQN